MTTAHTLLLAAAGDPNTTDLAKWLRGIFGPLFLAAVGIIALFFLFTREVTRFVQFMVLAVAVAVIFYYPGIIAQIAHGVATALGLKSGSG